MLIEKKEFHEVDTVEKITIADSFVVRANKLGTGNGEAKLYVGNENASVRNFFGTKGFTCRCFFLKSDLIKFLTDLKSEYKNPQLPYQQKNNLPILFAHRLSKLNKLPEIIFYTITEQTQIDGERVYVNSNDANYQLLRELPLPNLGYLSIRKLASVNGELLFYTRLFIDYLDSFGQTIHPIELILEEQLVQNDATLNPEEKFQISRARIGQGKYRKKLLED